MAKPDTWFRLTNTVVDNPKVQALPDALFKAWVNLLCVASQNHGVLPPLSDIAFKLRMSETKAATLLETLEKRFLFDRDETGSYVPHDWNDHQFKSDSSTDRVRAHRDRMKRRGNVPSETDETLHETFRNAQDETPHNITEHNITPVVPKGTASADFEAFWKAYPSRGKAANPKRPAWMAWERAVRRGATAADLIRLAPTAAPAEKHGTEYVPQATTWLNQDRWKDASPAEKPDFPTGFTDLDAQWLTRLQSEGWVEHLWGPKDVNDPKCKIPRHVWNHFVALTATSAVPASVKPEDDGLDIPEFMRR